MVFDDDIREIVCEGCDDNFCKRTEEDLIQCIKHLVENDEWR